MEYLNHETKTVIPEEFLKIGLEDYSYSNDLVGGMCIPKLYRFFVYPIYNHDLEELPEVPEKWEIYDHEANDSIGVMSVDQVVLWYQNYFKNIVEDALNLAIKHIQDEIEVKNGDFAGVYFSGEKWEELQTIFKNYLDAEIKNKNN